MTPEKKASSKYDYFAYYIGRPISYVCTVPFLKLGVSANTVSLISIVVVIAAFITTVFAKTKGSLLLAWLLFFVWNICDGIDGNIARFKKESSVIGVVLDAMSGYAAMCASFLAWGIAAAHHPGVVSSYVNTEYFIVLGSLSSIFTLFPRLVLHKYTLVTKEGKQLNDFTNKQEYNAFKILFMNITSVSGFMQVFMLLAVFLDLLDCFTIGYFLLNTAIMVYTIRSVVIEGSKLKQPNI